MMKCRTCGVDETQAEFVIDNSRQSGKRNICKECDRRRARERYQQKREEILISRQENYDPEAARERNKKWYLNNKDRASLRAKEAWAKTDKGAERERHAKWRKANPDKSRANYKRRDRRRRATAKGRLEDSVSRAISRSIIKGSKNGRRSFDLLDYSLDDLKAHLSRLFTAGMSWGNYGIGGWEIDHIVPRSAFNYATPDDLDFQRCWALSNLQPLWASDNRSKGGKVAGGFQPSLRLRVSDHTR